MTKVEQIVNGGAERLEGKIEEMGNRNQAQGLRIELIQCTGS